MMTRLGMRAIEFNCRFGDPEAQTVLPLLETDLVEVMDAVINSSLDSLDVRWRSEASACVVAASGGYPAEYATGKLIEGIEKAASTDSTLVFQAGTRLEHGQTLTDGGRVLSVTGLGADLPEAVARAYAGVRQIQFEGMHYRHDIAGRALQHLQRGPA